MNTGNWSIEIPKSTKINRKAFGVYDRPNRFHISQLILSIAYTQHKQIIHASNETFLLIKYNAFKFPLRSDNHFVTLREIGQSTPVQVVVSDYEEQEEIKIKQTQKKSKA